jgi:hypothetical protein
MIGSLGIPDQPGPRPAVLIAHEANGLLELFDEVFAQ